ncbi:ABC transporter permease [Alicyclobacillus acidoterrestris]|uniref:ABC transporter permease n=1 Tax=Alicyclobacillus acidoterrestris (strain ATCC 49025 / DSM 3922 / CIP 106132 / NCIMB 13137 / GD3B) TaxID=1356854 RepID=A0A9E6ZN20_ALIAG|nr:ABC transporter permease [Alicyclobacillus acidoterrestris]UNO50776.1 ABC transporter permease [Alicyclobacillus acidoterrestris]
MAVPPVRRKRLPFVGSYLPIVVLVIWQAVCSLQLVIPAILPSPLEIAVAFWQLARSGVLISDLKISLIRVVFGFLLGAGLGLITGAFAGLYKRFEDVVDPSVQMLRTVPHLAITPLFILWLGLGEWSKDVLIATGAFFPMYMNTFMGIRSVDAKLFEVARVLQFNRVQQFTKLMLPAALPNVLLGLRLAIGVSWLGLVVAEMLGSSSGVGYLILNAQQFSQTDVVFVGLIIFALVGKLSDSFVRLLERRLLRWRDNYTG